MQSMIEKREKQIINQFQRKLEKVPQIYISQIREFLIKLLIGRINGKFWILKKMKEKANMTVMVTSKLKILKLNNNDRLCIYF